MLANKNLFIAATVRIVAGVLVLAAFCNEGYCENRLEKYVVDYPAMEVCTVPIRSAFFDANSTFNVVNGRRFQYRPNGGYGLPVIDKVGGRNLLHVGADLGWFQVGEPVFAIGAGVVRVSQGPASPEKKGRDKSSHTNTARQDSMPWGNVVIIEHRLNSGDYYTMIYGHLDSHRRVAVGDLVKAGQCVGTIGRKSPQINGGYNPHLHFGVREGRMIRKGTLLFKVRLGGSDCDVRVADFDEEFVELEMLADKPDRITFRCNGEDYIVEDRDGKPTLPSRILWHIRDPSFPLVGYALTTDGWHDPIDFLHQNHAVAHP